MADHPIANGSSSRSDPQMPRQYHSLLNELSALVQQTQPDDLLQFCASFFIQKRKQMQNEHDGESSSTRNNPSENHVVIRRHRRNCVSSEHIDISALSEAAAAPVEPKTERQQNHIQRCLQNCILFSHLDQEQLHRVSNAFREIHVERNHCVFEQGNDGDAFYIVESGVLDSQVDGVKVARYDSSMIFGELAALYKTQRDTTVICRSNNATLWILDRDTFQNITVGMAIRKRRMLNNALANVPLLQSLEPTERERLVDVLRPVEYSDKEAILYQGDVSESFFLIEHGIAVAYKRANDGSQRPIRRLGQGEYFNEISLIYSRPCVTTILADGQVQCLLLERSSFCRLFGPVMNILCRNSGNLYRVLEQTNL